MNEDVLSKDWSGKLQTSKLFDKEIVSRMGITFYSRVFVRAIRKSIEDGEDNKDIRDSDRSDWNE